MPSSLIFVGLVLLWLLILVPTVARRRQEVARPSVAALSGRVLQRPQHGKPARSRMQEVDEMPDVDHTPPVTAEVPGEAPVADGRDADGRDADGRDADDRDADDRDADDRDADDRDADEDSWERPEPRYRPGRGGFDPAAAALAARARYAFRQRVVLTLLIAAVATGVAAALILPVLWWPHLLLDATLSGYLVYLRRQVRMEEAIRERRAARMAGTRRPAAAEDADLDEWARRGQAAAAGAGRDDAEPADVETDADADDTDRLDEESAPAALVPEPEPEPEPEPALPRLQPAAPPSLPSGTAMVGADDLDPDLPAFDPHARRDYRRAAGQ